MWRKIWQREKKGEKLLWHYRASSIIQMAAVPLLLFSLLGLNIKMAAPPTSPKKGQIFRRRSLCKKQTLEYAWLSHFCQSSWWAGDCRCNQLRDFEEEDIPVTYGLNSIKDRLMDCIISMKQSALPESQKTGNACLRAHFEEVTLPCPSLEDLTWPQLFNILWH